MRKGYKYMLGFLIFPALIMPIRLFAQSVNTDSLYAVLKKPIQDTNKVNALNALSKVLDREGECVKADSMIKQAIDLAIKLDYKTGISGSYRNLGSSYYTRHNTPDALKYYTLAFKTDSTNNYKNGLGMDYACLGLVSAQQGNYDQALKLYDIAANLLQESKNKDYLYRVYQFVGLVHKKRGDYALALTYYLQSLQVAEEMGNKQVAGDDYMDIGNVYTEQRNDSEAMKNYSKALQCFEQVGNKKGMGNAYCNIGNLFHDQKNDKAALDYYSKSLEIAEETGDKEGLTNAYGNIGNVYEGMGNYEQALKNHYQSLKIDEEIGDKEGVAEDYLNISGILTGQKKYAEANACIDKALVNAKELGSKILLQAVYEAKTAVDTCTKNYNAAYKDYGKSIAYRDSLINEENTKKIVSEQMKYEFDKKQAIEKAEQGRKDAIAGADKRKQQILTISISIGLLLVLIFSGLLFSRFRITQKQNKIIEEQKQVVELQKAIVEEKNKDITDSIKYASRIQKALLTTDEYIGKYIKEYFILFKPRDIVSGDFYWAYEDKGVFYIACCDCTGHGVPGAFMSLLNISMLNETVIEKKIIKPDMALNEIRRNIVKALNPDGMAIESQDGMDCVLCAINSKTGAVEAACANNPIWILQNGAITEIEPDKMPVGYLGASEKAFSRHDVLVNKGDTMYLFTDGFADQFGGPKGKKFKYKQLQDLLVANAGKSMAEQKEVLNNVFESWKGNVEQVDDVLIIGLRV